MDKKPTGLSDTFKKNTAPKNFIKNPINVLGGILLERFYPLLDPHLCTCLGYLQQIPF